MLAYVWMPLALLGALAVVLLASGASFRSLALSWVAMACGGLLLWTLSQPHAPMAPGWIGALVVLAAGALAPEAFLIAKSFRSSPESRAFAWAALLVFLVWMVAFFSSPSGSSGGMIRLAMRLFSVARPEAEMIVLVVRKTIHFTFYGTMAATALRWFLALEVKRQRAFLCAILFALAVASFDEGRQSLFPDRTSSARDVLLDVAGATCFLAVARKRKP